ncbi:O-antigen ligase family protein [Pseudoalteromonas distincta]|uniref:O-antigen ligase family protein n=1 Tax=Pseudoalteromonas distincta TaxID=77608 RepID=A0A4P9IZG3_9GAMM|nr:O-antigen ligase family protein [Pseudoalteromonas distincta]QCU73920.1 O-antigen ligase family protein [Pseudoalteromonas distincta]
MNRLLFFLLCSILFLLPLPLGSYRPWAILAMGLLICVTFLTHLINSAVNEKQPLYPPLYSWPVFATLGIVVTICAVQMFTVSVDPYQTKQMLIKTSFMIMFCWLIFIYSNSAQRIKKLVYTVIFAGVFQALYASYLNLSPDVISPIFSYKHTDRAIGTFTYSNFLANFLALCLCLGIGVLVSELKRSNSDYKQTLKQTFRAWAEILLSSKIILRISLIIIIVALILTRSRMGNSAFFIALMVVSLLAFFIYRQKPKAFKLLIVSFFIIDLIIIGAIFDVEKVKQRISETSISSETRDEVVRDSIPLILDKPLLGSGGGTFYTAFPTYQSEPYSGYYDNAHNDYVQFAVELGIPTTAALGSLILYCLWLCIATMRKRKTALFQGVAFGCAIAIIDMLLHSLVDYSLQAGANSMLFMTILCLAILSSKLPASKRSRKEHG